MHDEMEYPENLPVIFLSPDSPQWDPYDESYVMNNASYLDQDRDMVHPTLMHHNLLEKAAIAELKRDRPGLANHRVTLTKCPATASCGRTKKLRPPKKISRRAAFKSALYQA